MQTCSLLTVQSAHTQSSCNHMCHTSHVPFKLGRLNACTQMRRKVAPDDEDDGAVAEPYAMRVGGVPGVCWQHKACDQVFAENTLKAQNLQRQEKQVKGGYWVSCWVPQVQRCWAGGGQVAGSRKPSRLHWACEPMYLMQTPTPLLPDMCCRPRWGTGACTRTRLPRARDGSSAGGGR
jgi:hypothetical protein